MTKEKMTPGPATLWATIPDTRYIPVPTQDPTPNEVKSTVVKTCRIELVAKHKQLLERTFWSPEVSWSDPSPCNVEGSFIRTNLLMRRLLAILCCPVENASRLIRANFPVSKGANKRFFVKDLIELAFDLLGPQIKQLWKVYGQLNTNFITKRTRASQPIKPIA